MRLPPVNHRQSNEPFGRERFDVRPHRPEMVRVADCGGGDPLAPGFVAQQWRARPQRRLGEAISSVCRDQPWSRIADGRNRAAVEPPAPQRRDIAWQPQQAMAGRAIALAGDNAIDDRPGIFCGHAVTDEDAGHEVGQFGDADGLRHPAILGPPVAHNARPRRT
jgi:hypothetical protein